MRQNGFLELTRGQKRSRAVVGSDEHKKITGGSAAVRISIHGNTKQIDRPDTHVGQLEMYKADIAVGESIGASNLLELVEIFAALVRLPRAGFPRIWGSLTGSCAGKSNSEQGNAKCRRQEVFQNAPLRFELSGIRHRPPATFP